MRTTAAVAETTRNLWSDQIRSVMKREPRIFWLLLGVTCALSACSAQRSDLDKLAGETATCGECTINSEPVWVSASGDDDVHMASFFLEEGDYLWAMGGFADEKIVRYPLRGGSTQVYGRQGEGPGEIKDQIHGAALHSSGDTLVIAQLQRIEYFSTTIEPYRSFRPAVPVRGAMELLDDGSIVIADSRGSGPEVTSNRILHQFDAVGGHVGSWITLDSIDYAGARVWIARGHEPQTVWVSTPIPSGRRLSQWDSHSKSRIRRFDVTLDWWYEMPRSPEEVESHYRSGQVEPLKPSTVLTDFFDDGTVLWLSVGHADPDFRSVDPRYFLPSKRYDTLLLAVDRETGAVLAVEAFDEIAPGFTNRGNLVLYRLDRIGRPRLELRKVEFRREGLENRSVGRLPRPGGSRPADPL